MKLHPMSSALVAALCLAGAVLLTVHIAGQSRQRIAPPPLAAIPPASNDLIGLGRLLFWDPLLSGHRDVACATCHHPDFAYADGRDLSLGTGAAGLGPARRDRSGGRIPVVKRNSPTILNTAFNGLDEGRGRRRNRAAPTLAAVSQAAAPMLWDSRIQSLEAQALEPLKSREEMRGDAYSEAEAVERVVSRLRGNAEYVALFKRAFGAETSIDAQQLGQAIAAFERTLVAVNSPFDRFQAGDDSALTAPQKRGFEAFDRAGCDRCHEGPMFSDFNLHAEGVKENAKLAEPDAGTRRYRFRTPTLRNVALTAPYMHNGVLATLEDVLRFYDNGRSENPNVAGGRGREGGGNGVVATLARRFVRVNDMTDGEMRDIVAFLESLSDTGFDRTIPPRVPSGLTPGGAIAGAAAATN
jgi:cytochrome c peroxidase